MIRPVAILCVCLGLSVGPTQGRSSDAVASDSTQTEVMLYDTGLALVHEERQVSIDRGETTVSFHGVPARLDPASCSFRSMAGGSNVRWLEHRLAYDGRSPMALFKRLRGSPIHISRVADASVRGTLVGVQASDEGGLASVDVRLEDGSMQRIWPESGLSSVRFPDARDRAYLEPQLRCRVEASASTQLHVRLAYLVEGMAWRMHYEGVCNEAFNAMRLETRLHLSNGSGGRFSNVRLKLGVTQRGRLSPLFGPGAAPKPPLRYGYGAFRPSFEQAVAGLGVLEAVDIERPVTLEEDEEKILVIGRAHHVPISRMLIYDGVRFDRFQRNRRLDWSYGTESHQAIEARIVFENKAAVGLGTPMPSGLFRLYQERGRNHVDFIGDEPFPSTVPDATCRISVGPVRGLRGDRERISYREVVPLHQYDESFAIRLWNETEDDVVIRVVEHLYRWHTYEITKADSAYSTPAPQTIAFLVDVKAGGKRSIHYTVRYAW